MSRLICLALLLATPAAAAPGDATDARIDRIASSLDRVTVEAPKKKKPAAKRERRCPDPASDPRCALDERQPQPSTF